MQVEPLSAAFGFATIIGLIADFRTQKTGAKLDEFIEWLKETEHGRIAREIEQRDSLSEQLQAVLSLNHEELSMRLDSLDRILSSIARHIHVFSGLAESIHPAHELSKQGVSIVKQFADGEDRKSTRLNSSHVAISYAVFCLKKKKNKKKTNNYKTNL